MPYSAMLGGHGGGAGPLWASLLASRAEAGNADFSARPVEESGSCFTWLFRPSPDSSGEYLGRCSDTCCNTIYVAACATARRSSSPPLLSYLNAEEPGSAQVDLGCPSRILAGLLTNRHNVIAAYLHPHRRVASHSQCMFCMPLVAASLLANAYLPTGTVFAPAGPSRFTWRRWTGSAPTRSTARRSATGGATTGCAPTTWRNWR